MASCLASGRSAPDLPPSGPPCKCPRPRAAQEEVNNVGVATIRGHVDRGLALLVGLVHASQPLGRSKQPARDVQEALYTRRVQRRAPIICGLVHALQPLSRAEERADDVQVILLAREVQRHGPSVLRLVHTLQTRSRAKERRRHPGGRSGTP